MKILAFGDVYGRTGRNALKANLPALKKKYEADVVIVNVDNISSWRWAISEHLDELSPLWVDIMTSGDHFFDNKESLAQYIAQKECKLIRPANFYDVPLYPVPWNWYKVIEIKGKKFCVIHLMWWVFMKFDVYNPFLKLQELLSQEDIKSCDIIVVDFHKEATSEIQALWRYFDGNIHLLYGTHTHVQTNDEEILPGGCGYITDVWMCWPKKSIIWADIDCLKWRFFTGVYGKISQSLDKEFIVQGIFADIQDKKTIYIEKIQIKWTL